MKNKSLIKIMLMTISCIAVMTGSVMGSDNPDGTYRFDAVVGNADASVKTLYTAMLDQAEAVMDNGNLCLSAFGQTNDVVLELVEEGVVCPADEKALADYYSGNVNGAKEDCYFSDNNLYIRLEDGCGYALFIKEVAEGDTETNNQEDAEQEQSSGSLTEENASSSVKYPTGVWEFKELYGAKNEMTGSILSAQLAATKVYTKEDQIVTDWGTQKIAAQLTLIEEDAKDAPKNTGTYDKYLVGAGKNASTIWMSQDSLLMTFALDVNSENYLEDDNYYEYVRVQDNLDGVPEDIFDETVDVSTNNVVVESEEEEIPEETEEVVDPSAPLHFEVDGGILDYVGYEYPNKGMFLNSDDGDKTIILNFDYTNKEKTPKTYIQDFSIHVFQNGVELDQPGPYDPDASPESVENAYKQILEDTTITIGRMVVLNDTSSPVTVIANHNGGFETSNPMEIQLEEKEDKSFDLNRIYGRWQDAETGEEVMITSSEIRYSKGGFSSSTSNPRLWTDEASLHQPLSILGETLQIVNEPGQPLKLEGSQITLIQVESWPEEEITDGDVVLGERQYEYYEECPALPTLSSVMDVKESGSNKRMINGVTTEITYRYKAGKGVAVGYTNALSSMGFNVRNNKNSWTIYASDFRVGSISLVEGEIQVNIEPDANTLTELTLDTESGTETEAAIKGEGTELQNEEKLQDIDITENDGIQACMAAIKKIQFPVSKLNKKTVTDAQELYDSLSDEEKKQVDNISVLEKALEQLNGIDSNKEYYSSKLSTEEDFVAHIFWSPYINEVEYGIKDLHSIKITGVRFDTERKEYSINVFHDGYEEHYLFLLEGANLLLLSRDTDLERNPDDHTYNVDRINEQINKAMDVVIEDPETVLKVQQALNEAGYDCGTPDGILGEKTKSAIDRYWHEKGYGSKIVVDKDLLSEFGLNIESSPASESETEKKSKESEGNAVDSISYKTGDTETSTDWKVTLTDAYTTDTLSSSESSTYWTPSDGYAFLVLEFDITCLNSTKPTVDDEGITNLVATVNGNTYENWEYQYIANELWLYIRHTYLDANLPLHVYVYTYIPSSNMNDKITIDLKVAGQDKKIVIGG